MSAEAPGTVPRPRPRQAAPGPVVVPIDPGTLHAVSRGHGLRLVAQPILAVETSSIVGYELLSRMAAPHEAPGEEHSWPLPSPPPDRWFAAARSMGLASELTCSVFTAMHELRETLPADTFCTVNVEPDLLLEPAVQEVLHSTGDLNRVVVELTEHVTVGQQLPALLRALDGVREAGGTVAVDDAGTGYAGLSQLLSVRPDLVKLDATLVTGLGTDPVRRALVSMLGDLVGRMDAWLLAEGVETPDDLGVLASLGVPLAQGWFIGLPEAPWSTLDPTHRERIRALCARADFDQHLAALLHAERTRTEPSVDMSAGDVIVDPQRRPLWVVTPQVGGLALAPAMTTAISADVGEVLRRAMARPPEHRAAPVICTDGHGAYIGSVEVPGLVDAVLHTYRRPQV